MGTSKQKIENDDTEYQNLKKEDLYTWQHGCRPCGPSNSITLLAQLTKSLGEIFFIFPIALYMWISAYCCEYTYKKWVQPNQNCNHDGEKTKKLFLVPIPDIYNSKDIPSCWQVKNKISLNPILYVVMHWIFGDTLTDVISFPLGLRLYIYSTCYTSRI